MKNSKQYAEKFKSFLSQAKRKKTYKPEVFEDNTDCIVKAMLAEFLSDQTIKECLEVMRPHFVDWNDLRVSRPEEIIDILTRVGVDAAVGRRMISAMLKTLNIIFEKLDRITLEELDEGGKKQAKQVLDDLGEISPFASAFVLLFLKDMHVVPIDYATADMLKSNGLVDNDAEISDIIGFITRQVGSQDSLATYYILRDYGRKYAEDLRNKAKVDAEKQKLAEEKAAKKAAIDAEKAQAKATKKTTKKVEPTGEDQAPVKKVAKKTTKRPQRKRQLRRRLKKPSQRLKIKLRLKR